MAVKPRTVNQFGRIGVLMGGPSSEREISLKSGKAVYDALSALGADVVGIDIKSDGVEENILLINSQEIDCAFLALHGRFGEDGMIQMILENMRIPYTGSGVLASKLAMDKVSSREIFKKGKLLVPRSKVVNKLSYKQGSLLELNLGSRLVIKPASQGSSIGLSIIDHKDDLAKALEVAFKFDDTVIIEEYIKGREMTVGILEESALPVIEIIPSRAFFDFEAKYKSGLTEYVVPARINKKSAAKIQAAALSAHKLLGCFGYSRVDLILNEEGDIYVLEVNTIPGMTSTSLLPKAAGKIRIKFEELCMRLIKLAYEKAEKHYPL
ncbi:MAG: D-alanine--D-alanine ligase [Candidatus Omnitrophota bacterium]|jgi:D-alanine-D-alanine ligase